MGYEQELHSTLLRPWFGLWDKILHGYCIPLVNMLCWVLVHGKTLTIDNLRKKGTRGPFWCVLSQVVKETQHHLFLEYSYTKSV